MLFVSWSVKVLIHPFPTRSAAELLDRIAVGPLSGWFVLLIGVAFNGFLFWLLFSTRDPRGHDEEALPREQARQRMGTGEVPK